MESQLQCLVCGAAFEVETLRCSSCGEPSNSTAAELTGQPTRIHAGDILHRAWQVYVSDPASMAASMIVVGLASSVVKSALNSASHGSRFEEFLSAICGMAFGFLLQVGQVQLFVAACRGEKTGFTLLFSGAKFIGRVFLGWVLFATIAISSTLLLLVPGVLVTLIFWPFSHVMIIENRSILQSFRRARELTRENHLSGFLILATLTGLQSAVICLAAFLMSINRVVGLLTFGLGILLIVPYCLLTLAMAYTAMSGIRTAERPEVVKSQGD